MPSVKIERRVGESQGHRHYQRKCNDRLLERKMKFTVIQKYRWRLHEQFRQIRFNLFSQDGLSVNRDLCILFQDQKSLKAKLQVDSEGWGLIFFSARDASLSHKEQSIEVDTARGILTFRNPPRLDHFKFLFWFSWPWLFRCYWYFRSLTSVREQKCSG